MKTFVLAAIAAGLSASAALADAPGPGFRPGVRAVHRDPAFAGQRRHVRHRRALGHAGAFGPEPFVPAGPGYGPEPPFFEGHGTAAPGGPVAISEYREAYIGRGLVYNVPPQPFLAGSGVISVRY